MRFRATLLLVALAPVLCFGQSQVKMRIFLNGSPVGESVYERNGDAFSSKSSLDLGSIKISGTTSGHFKNGKLIDSIAESANPGGKSKVTYSKGVVEGIVGTKKSSAKWQDKTGHLGANLHPQLFAATLEAADKAIKASPSTKSVELPVFFVDAGAVLPIKVTLRQASQVEVAGKTVTVNRYSVDALGTVLEFVVDPEGRIVAEDVPTQKLRFLVDGWEGVFVDPMAKFPELSQATFKTKTEKGVRVKMRDGVELVCDIVRPDTEGSFPTVLERTPYGRGPSAAAGGHFYASRGYVFISQDCRGREDSDGHWDPFVNEGPDGYDTIQWIAQQPWSDGKVGMIGGSYSGYVQWAAAVLNPPALKCIVPQVSPPDGMRNIPYDHGVFFLYGNLWWAKIVAGKKTDFSNMQALPHPSKFTTLPLSKVDDAVLGEDLEFFNKWLTRPTITDWKGMDFTFQMENATVPALHISGIWDGDAIGTHLNWHTMRNLRRDNQWIIYGPWVHAFNTTKSLGDTDYGPNAIIDLDSVYLRWFDTWLKDKKVRLDSTAKVRLFVTGANRWLDLPDWPAPTTPARTLYISKKGLTEVAPVKPETHTYTYDPAKDTKVPKEFTGATAEPSTKLTADHLKPLQMFRSEPFQKATAISGPFKVTLHFSSSAKDTDFFAALVDIAPNGETRLLGQQGKIRASYLQGLDAVRPIEPGKQYVAEIVPWDFAHEFKKGHRLGLAISSTMFPLYARNLGTGEPIENAVKMVAQKNTIYMGSATPSSLTFHILWER